VAIFFIFSDDPLSERTNFIFLAVSANQILLDYVIDVYFVKISLASYYSGQKALLPVGYTNLQIQPAYLIFLPVLCCLGLVRPQQQANQLLPLFNYTPHMELVMFL
jgi:hypothetical protein